MLLDQKLPLVLLLAPITRELADILALGQFPGHKIKYFVNDIKLFSAVIYCHYIVELQLSIVIKSFIKLTLISNIKYRSNLPRYLNLEKVGAAVNYHSIFNQGVQKLTGGNQKVVWAEFSTIS